MSTIRQAELQWGQHSDPGPPWYTPQPSARSETDPLGDYIHSIAIDTP